MTTITETADRTDTGAARAEAGKYLTFGLGAEAYGLPILSVREINRLIDATEVPDAPPAMRGVINLRGRVIPLLDLRVRFGLPPADATESTCTIIIEATTGLVGMVVDDVREVVEFEAAAISPTPPAVDSANRYIAGVAQRDEAITLLLDPAHLVGGIGVPEIAAATDAD